MKLPPLQFAILLKRYKRFLVDIQKENGEILTIYSPNTGKMTNCSDIGAKVAYSDSNSLTRKLRYTLELVENNFGWVGVRPDLANELVKEAFFQKKIPEFLGYQTLLQEIPYGKSSRIDLLLKNHPTQADCYIEVKSVTWANAENIYLFPDAPSQRASKQLEEMIDLIQQGFRAMVVYVIQCSGGYCLQTAQQIDPKYAETVLKAKNVGIEFLAWHCLITPEEIILQKSISVI